MERSGRCVTMMAAAILCWGAATTAQEQAAAPQEQTTAVPEEIVDAPRRFVAEEPATLPEEPAATGAPLVEKATVEEAVVQEAIAEDVIAGEPAAEEPAAEEPIVEEPIVKAPETVKFLDINDALATRFFDAAASAPDPNDPTRLILAIHTGSDPATWRANDFRASTAAFSHQAAVDTISFRIQAPPGQRIAKVTYTQRGSGSAIRLGKAAGATQWVVGDYAAQVGVFGTNPSLVGVADLAAVPRSTVDVSITTGLFVFAAPTSGSASVEVTSADVQVELVPAEGL